MSLRIERVNKEIKRNLMEIIQQQIDNPSLGIVSITKVNTSPDLKKTKVYFSVLNDEKINEVEVVLNKMKGFIRSSLGKRLRIRSLPQLFFFPDESIKYSIYIYKKIEEVRGGNKENNRGDKEE